MAMDGKSSRGRHAGAAAALPLVSACAAEAPLVLAQEKVAEKSNEMTAIPEWLDLLDMAGPVIPSDAMGTQKNSAAKIVEKEADDVLALKGNQSTLADDVRLFCEQPLCDARLLTHEETDKGHGRIEGRRCCVTGDMAWLRDTHDGSGLASILRLQSTRRIDGESSCETRFSILSLPPDPVRLLGAVRRHGALENNLHGVWDRTFGDDRSRIRQDHAPLNLSIIRQAALNLLQQAQQKRQSSRRLRNNAAWDSTTLRRILAYAN
jgi:predicted transposase YbfD/YdcC